MKVTEKIMAAIRAGREAWQLYDDDSAGNSIANMYETRWALFTGTMFSEAWRAAGYRPPKQLYAGTRLLWKHIESVVTFYAMTVYQGELATDGKPLPDGSRGAIPLVPETGSDETDDILRKGIGEAWSAWNWRHQMTLRPMYGAALGDVLTELVDDPERGMVYPSIVWPGYVKDIEIDFVGNVKYYMYEYRVREQYDNGTSKSYMFRKEVDGETIRYFKDEKPFAYYGDGTEVIEHGYGFVPAIWDRHRVLWGERGAAATDGTMEALLELNSLLSHGKHVQHKAFSAPIIVRGEITRPGQTEVKLRRPTTNATSMSETTEWLQGSKDADLVQPQFDLGQTLSMIEEIRNGISDENPESRFFRDLRNMNQVSAPGIERALGDAVGRCRLARGGYDSNTVKLFQMMLAMCGNRVRLTPEEGGWARPLNKRQSAFAPFNLDSYKAGLLDFTISERPVVLSTEEERIRIVRQKEAIQTPWGFEQIGVNEADAETIIASRGDANWSRANGGGFQSLLDSGLSDPGATNG